uniref:4-Hydroxyphenylacetate decarboxylase subunit gamma n=1 Tax=virus sp. ctpeS3 TaxID=2826815 RepID=A0A8S5R9C9_9VIRU|nr:MAG TPA: 4-Hydroxyphenylacetate decarboxylase subunit gamma [virus sp. ctpeS3]
MPLYCKYFLPFDLTKVYQMLSTNTIDIMHKIRH